MNRIGYLTLLSLLLVIGIVSCKSFEPIPTDLPEADSIIIWFEGKGINLEKENSIFDGLSIEAARVINEIKYFSQSYSGPENTTLDWERQNEKCLEIEFKEPFRRYNDDPEFMGGALIISSVLFSFSEEHAHHNFFTYSEKTGGWYLWGSLRSTDGLLKMVDGYLGVSH